MKSKITAIAILLCALGLQTIAQDDPPGVDCCTSAFQGFSIFSENDILNPFMKNKDDNYTGSLKIALRYSAIKRERWKYVSWVIPSWVSVNNLANGPDLESFKGSLGFVLFTPQIIDQPIPDPLDRPFGSFKFLELSHSVRIPFGSTELFFDRTLMIGKLGKNLARDFQVAIHNWNWISRPISTAGWSTQLGAGELNKKGAYPGEFAFNYNFTLGAIMFSSPSSQVVDWNPHIRPAVTGQFGLYLNKVALGTRLNVFGNYSAKDVFFTAAPGVSKEKDIILYFTPTFGYVIHNSMLEGRPFGLNKNDIYHLNSADVKRGVWDLEAVAGFRVKRVALLWNVLWRSREFTLQKAKAWHGWGGINLVYTCSKYGQ